MAFQTPGDFQLQQYHAHDRGRSLRQSTRSSISTGVGPKQGDDARAFVRGGFRRLQRFAVGRLRLAGRQFRAP